MTSIDGHLDSATREKLGAALEDGRLVTFDVDLEELDRPRDAFLRQVVGEVHAGDELAPVRTTRLRDALGEACFRHPVPARLTPARSETAAAVAMICRP